MAVPDRPHQADNCHQWLTLEDLGVTVKNNKNWSRGPKTRRQRVCVHVTHTRVTWRRLDRLSQVPAGAIPDPRPDGRFFEVTDNNTDRQTYLQADIWTDDNDDGVSVRVKTDG